ncbi:MAG: hypothetical protein IPM29_08460 [Planctomycetes bacterium]|nr:hypothetical protein [Planctomycetota bacterium]
MRSARSAAFRSPLAALLAIALLAGAVTTQTAPTHTAPAGYLTRAGNARHWVPAYAAPSMAQTTFASSAIDLPTRNLSRIWLRPDEATSTPMVAHRLNTTLFLTSRDLPTPEQVLSYTYAGNRGSDRRRVLDAVPIDFPAHTSPSGATTPQPWRVSIPIQPFPFTAGSALQVEWRFETPGGGPSTASWFVDADLDERASTYGYYLRHGEQYSCPDRYTNHGGDVGGPGQLCSIWWYSNAPNGSPAVTFFGRSLTAWNGTALPFDLTPYGFPGCTVQTDLTIAWPSLTDMGGAGRVRIDVHIPNDPALADQRIYAQTFVGDPAAPGGLRVSDHGKVAIGIIPQSRFEQIHLYSYQYALSDAPEFVTLHAPILGLY